MTVSPLQRVSQPTAWLMHGSVYLASNPIHPNVPQCYNSRGVVYQIVFLPIQMDQLLSTHSWNTALQDTFYNFLQLYTRLYSTLRCTLRYTLLYFTLHKKGLFQTGRPKPRSWLKRPKTVIAQCMIWNNVMTLIEVIAGQ